MKSGLMIKVTEINSRIVNAYVNKVPPVPPLDLVSGKAENI